METMKRNGGRIVELFAPVKVANGSVLDVVEIAPISFDHTIRWQRGVITSTLALLSELSGRSEADLRCIGYPDIDRVFVAFVSTLPPEIRADIEAGTRPTVSPDDTTVLVQQPRPPPPPTPAATQTAAPDPAEMFQQSSDPIMGGAFSRNLIDG